ncbi:MAG: hypothetical protein IKE53_03880 [Clostridiales bacterium]|nr:hypothetical protein [Clostridiales bacterium]
MNRVTVKNKKTKSFAGKRKLWQRFLSHAIVFLIVTNTILLEGIFGLFGFKNLLKVKAEDIPSYTPTYPVEEFSGTSFSFSNDDTGKTKFVDYCYYYLTDDGNTFCNNHKSDTLSITFTDLPESFQFMGLGNSTTPFQGSVQFITSGGASNISLPRALFSYVSTDAQITDGSGTPITLEITRNSTASSPLLADHVYPGSGSANWSITVPSSNSNSFAGVIGQIETNANVTLVFNNASSAAVSNTASGASDIKDVGELCGIMKTGSSLTVTDNSSARTAVSSTNGNAGSLVGVMEGTASLTLSSYPALTGISVTSGSGYAGGLVGVSNTSATISGLSSPEAISGTVTGSTGAGGLYGYYANSASAFDLSNYNITATVTATNCGGVFGVLENNKGDSAAISLTIQNTGNAGTVSISSGSSAASGYFGGIAGKYLTDALTNSLILDRLTITAASNASFDSFGGAIGIVDSAAYIKADGLTVNATGTAKKDSAAYFGGLIGKTSDDHGVFVDLGNFTLNNSSESLKGGGVVGSFSKGVLRLSGTTDMSGAKSQKGGQLIGVNDNVLTYALGTGTNGSAYESGWTFKRSDSSQVDDLGTWGEVVRIENIEDATNGILTLDSTNHTVTVKAAETSMGTKAAFAKTALNIQLNQGAGYDCLLFTSGDANTRSALLGSTLNLTADISLAGTGITGFMRDGSSSVGIFTGTLNGGSHIITLAVGEKYGQDSSGTAITPSSTGEGLGQIYYHPYNGLFAVIGNGTTGIGRVNSLTIAGTMDVHNKIAGMYIGGIAAVSQGSTTLNGITANQTINYSEPSAVTGDSATGKNIGGLIGIVNGSNNGTIAITGTNTISTAINISGNYKGWTCVGAAIGKITSPQFTVNIAQDSSDKLTVSHTMTVANGTSVGTNADGGGLIGYITSGSDYTKRQVNINHLDFDRCTIVNKATTNGGGFLGYEWLDTDTTIDGLTVTDGTITNSSQNVGVMCYEATGRWKVKSLTITKMNMSSGAGTSLGMLVNKAYSGKNGLYLNVLRAGYTLTDKTGSSGITLPSSLGIYDELAAYSADDVIKGTYDSDHGAGVISINMNSGSGTKTKIREYSSSTENGTGTYQNQLTNASSALASAAKYPNAKTRYYYNLDVMDKTNSAEEDIMLWSVNQYAASNIKICFASSTSPFFLDSETNVDLSGYSYYPVYRVSSLSLKNINLNFGYSGIYTVEGNTTLNTDNYNRDPGEQNQHYLMQSGLFINGTEGSALTLNTVKLSGDFLENSTYKGVLFSGTTNGYITINGLELDGITPKYNNSGTISNYTNGYLLVNNVTREDSFKENIQITMQNVNTSNKYKVNDVTAKVSKSLFGDVYGPSIVIRIEGVRLDARRSDSVLTGTNKENLDNKYGTVNSIFTEATFFNSLKTTQTAGMIYNYTVDEDWGDGTPRNVTYGREVSESVEYQNKEKKYFNSDTFTHPITATGEYNFNLGWIPYVAIPYTANQTPDANGCFYRELKVNVPSTEYSEGCGTYNDPYIIDKGDKLVAIANLISDDSASNIYGLKSLQLPKSPDAYDSVAENTMGARWCNDKSDHAVFTYDEGIGKYKATIDGETKIWTVDNVRLYLANAYYKLTFSEDDANGNIVLNSSYIGLGGTAANYAFRGVIVGDPSYKIINNSQNPLVNVSNGCVVKDVNVEVNADITLNQDNNGSTNAYFGYDSKCKYYGGLIGEIMGGDNIIDNSYVNFDSTTITLTGSNGTIVPVGGDVGVIVYGGLVFKNIDARKTTLAQTHLNVVYNGSMGTTTSGINLASETKSDGNKNQEAWAAIYVNPLVGRVINGYAVNETGGYAKDASGAAVTQFSVTEDGHYHDDGNSSRSGVTHTLRNGTKHYTIADLNPNLDEKLDVTSIPESGSVNGSINVPNSQALFVLSLITQSGAGTAQTLNDPNSGGTHNDDTVVTSDVTDESGNRTIRQTRTITDIDDSMSSYPCSLSYGNYDGNIYGMSHTATYEDVGTDSSSSSDYTTYVGYDTAANIALPYIISHYTVGGLKIISTSVEGDPVVVESTLPGSIDPFTGTDLDGKSLAISVYANNNKRYYMDVFNTGQYGFKATENIDDATVLLFTRQKSGEHAGKYTISYVSNGALKYIGFTNNSRNLISSDNPLYFSIYTEGGNWKIEGEPTGAGTETRRFLALRNPGQSSMGFTGQNKGPDGNIDFYIETPGPTVTTTTITTTVTNTNTIAYPARCVTSTMGYYDINLSTSVSYQLPDSFRGLGCVGIYDTVANVGAKYGMKIDTFDGKGCTIDQDVYLNKFQTDNYFDVLHAGTTQDLSSDSQEYYGNVTGGTNDNHGIGLFDNVITKDSSSQIKDFILSGSVNTEIFNNTYATHNQELALVTTGRSQKSLWLSVGGVCGWSGNGISLTFNKIRLNNLMVNGADFVGGLLGFSGTSDTTVLVTVRECSATNISIKMSSANAIEWGSNTADNSSRARNGMGCFVGKVLEGGVRIFGTAGTTETTLNEDLTKFSTVTIKDFGFADDSIEYYTTAGGLVGFAGNGCKVYDMKVMPAEGETITIGSDKTRYAGGLVGLMQPKDKGGNSCETVFYNCTVQEINVNGHYAGGFYGGKWINEWSPYSIKIDNCKMVGNTSSNNTITGNNMANNGYAGGFLGCGNVYTDGNPNIEISDSKVSNYTITSNASTAYVGGFIGYTGAQAANKSITCYIHDSSVEDCTIGAGNNYGGGAIGQVVRRSTSSNNKILGYNIKLDTVIIGSNNKGAWIGYVDSSDNTTDIKFAGVGIYGNGYERNVGNRATFSNASFVFADYGEACGGSIPEGETELEYSTDISTFNNTDNVIMPKYPYVNINPQSSMGDDEIISSDAAVLSDSASTSADYSGKTAEETMALKIYEDTKLTDTSATNYSRRYTTFSDDTIYNNHTISYYMQRMVGNDGDRISNYYDEKGYTSAQAYDNFACIVIANNNTQETTNLINRYAQLVTNTETDYVGTDANDSYFDIVINTCKLDGGKFVIDTTRTSTQHGLSYSGGELSLNGAYADSSSVNGETFTLVDIQFKDPLHTDKVAYHLYIPVYTIKEMEITFTAAVLNGTDSASYTAYGTPDVNPYSTRLSETGLDTHVDNLNTWYTTYIRYTYNRSDIVALINSGNLNWSHNKYFYLDKTSHNATSMLPANAYMILVDPNGDHDKKYQVELNETDFARNSVTVTTGNTSETTTRIRFDLTKFTDRNDNPFEVSTLNELIAMKLTAVEPEVANTGMYNEYSGEGTPENTGATHYIYTENSAGVKTYYEYVGNGGAYNISLESGDIYENYYISIYVPGSGNDNSLYGYYIRTPESFAAPSYASGTNNAITKSAKVNCYYASGNYNGENAVNRQVYIGNLFDQTTSLTVLPNNLEIDAGNHTLNIYATTTITAKDVNIVSILNSVNADIYHSFNLYLDRKGEDGNMLNTIYGIENDGIKAWYSVGTPIPTDTEDMEGFTQINTSDIHREDSYINVVTVNGGNTVLSSSGVTIYSRIRLDFDNYIAEFPQKVNADTGVSVRAASNLAYDADSLAFSSMSVPIEELDANKHIFYRQSYESATLSYNGRYELDSYDTDGYPSENYSRLGVSGRYSMNEYMPIDTIAQYYVQNIEGALSDATTLQLTLSLQKKTDSPAGGPYTSASYQNVSSLNSYWGAVRRDSSTHEVTPNDSGAPVTEANTTNLRIVCGDYDAIVPIPNNTGETFTLTIPKPASGFPVDENGYINIYIGFNAKTGDDFTEYANYKVILAVSLLDASNDTINGSYASDSLIYTNAKVNHEFLKLN